MFKNVIISNLCLLVMLIGCDTNPTNNDENSNNNAPVITSQPNDVSVSEGEIATFQVGVVGDSLNYMWYVNGVFINNNSTFSYTINNVALADSGSKVSVSIYNSIDTIQSDTAILTVTRKDNGNIFDSVEITDGMVIIEAKNRGFSMGSDKFAKTKPIHIVKFSKDFWMDKSEVTQKEYSFFMQLIYRDCELPEYSYPEYKWEEQYGIGDSHPAYSISWYDAVLYCNERSKAVGKDTVYSYSSIELENKYYYVLTDLVINYDKNGYRLPTEAEWEYACRAGTTGDFYWGSDESFAKNYAWFNGNSESEYFYTTHEVESKTSNDFDLYDMAGSVEEWCNDWYGEYSSDVQHDPVGLSNGEEKILRGGCFMFTENYLYSGARSNSEPKYGFERFGFRTMLPIE